MFRDQLSGHFPTRMSQPWDTALLLGGSLASSLASMQVQSEDTIPGESLQCLHMDSAHQGLSTVTTWTGSELVASKHYKVVD